MAPQLEKVAETLGDRCRVLKIDSDEEPEVSNALQVDAAPHQRRAPTSCPLLHLPTPPTSHHPPPTHTPERTRHPAPSPKPLFALAALDSRPPDCPADPRHGGGHARGGGSHGRRAPAAGGAPLLWWPASLHREPRLGDHLIRLENLGMRAQRSGPPRIRSFSSATVRTGTARTGTARTGTARGQNGAWQHKAAHGTWHMRMDVVVDVGAWGFESSGCFGVLASRKLGCVGVGVCNTRGGRVRVCRLYAHCGLWRRYLAASPDSYIEPFYVAVVTTKIHA